MGYKIQRRKINYQAGHIIKKLGDFLLKNKEFFDLFIKIIIDGKKSLMETNVKILVDRFVIAKVIKEEEADIFLKLYFDFQHYEEKGNLLEYIAQKLGPFGLEGRNCDYSCRSNFIYDEKQIGSADFDLIFFNRESAEYYEDCIYIKEDEGEFIECKTDVRTFISEELSHTSQKKLNFIKSVYESLKANPKCLFFIVTFRKNVAIYEDILKKNNYEFISIISGRELLNKV